MVLLLLFLGLLGMNLLSFLLFTQDAAQYNRGNWSTCILFVDKKCNDEGTLPCNLTLCAEIMTSILTILMILVYVMWLGRGTRL